MSVSSKAEGEASKKGLTGAAKRQYVGGAINRAKHEKADTDRSGRDVAYHARQDARLGLTGGTHGKLARHGFYVLEPQVKDGPWTIYRDDGKVFRGITEAGAAGGESGGVRAVYSRKDVEAFADLVAANPGAITPRTRKAQEDLAIKHTREGKIDLPATPAARSKTSKAKQAHSYQREAIADARSQIRYHEAQITGLREGLKMRRELAGAKPPAPKANPRTNLVVRNYVDPKLFGPDRPLDPYLQQRVYGDDQLRASLNRFSLRDLRPAAEIVEKRTGRKLRKGSKAALVDDIVANVTGEQPPTPRAAPVTRPLPQPKPKRAPRPKAPPTIEQQIERAGGYVPKTPADKLRKLPVREMTDAQLLRDWENHPPERRRGVLEREMARRRAKAEKAQQPKAAKPSAKPAAKRAAPITRPLAKEPEKKLSYQEEQFRRKHQFKFEQGERERARKAEQDARYQRNLLLKQHGYQWRKVQDVFGRSDNGDSAGNVWQLYDARGRPVSEAEALRHIEQK